MSEHRNRPIILIADDDRDLRDLIKEHLEDGNWELITAGDGQEALLKAIEFVPDLVILDVMMPRLNGWEVCRAIRQRKETQHIRVIILTAIGQQLNELTSPLYGADAQIDKPFDFEDLDLCIRTLLASA